MLKKTVKPQVKKQTEAPEKEEIKVPEVQEEEIKVPEIVLPKAQLIANEKEIIRQAQIRLAALTYVPIKYNTRKDKK